MARRRRRRGRRGIGGHRGDHRRTARPAMRRNTVPAVQATRDKRMLRRCLTESGLPQPRYAESDVIAGGEALESAITVAGLPCVTKPVDLAASRGVIRADDRTAAAVAVQRIATLLREICD